RQHPLLEHGRHRVLEPLGLLVDLVPRDPAHVGEETLDTGVQPADHLSTCVRKRAIGRCPREITPASLRPLSVKVSDLSSARSTYPSPSSRPIISWTAGGQSCITRAMLAPFTAST